MAPPADKKKPAAAATSAETATKKYAKPPGGKAKEPSGAGAEKIPKPAAVKVEKPKLVPAAAAPRPTPPMIAKKLDSKTPKVLSLKKHAQAVTKTEKKTIKSFKQHLKGKSGVLNKKKKISTKFIIDCTDPVEDDLFNSTDFENFLKENIKVQGKRGALRSNILIESVGGKTSKLIINAKIPFSKRYLKYLTKKYLKKIMLRDTLRVISTARDTYKLKYFQIGSDPDDDDEDNDFK